MSGTEEWLGVVEAAESLNWYVGVWHDLGYADPPAPGCPGCKTIPPLGERSAEAVKGAHDAIEVIDIMVRELQAVRDQLTGELKADEAAREDRA